MAKLGGLFCLLIVGGLLSLGITSAAFAQVRTVPACQIDNPPTNCNSGNMFALEVTVNVPNGAYVHVPDPGCMNDATGDIQRTLQAAMVVGSPSLAMFSGILAPVLAGPVGNYLRNQGGDIGKYFSPYAKNGALCAPVIAVVPVSATVLGYRLLAAEMSGVFSGCQAGADCSIGWSKFQSEPVVQGNQSMRTATSIFMNWSHNRQRRARVIMFYTLPQGQRPLTQM